MTERDRRLIEDYLPLDVINAIASREKLTEQAAVARRRFSAMLSTLEGN